MNKSLAKLLSSTVDFRGVFSRYKQQPRHKVGNRLNVNSCKQMVKANPIGSYSNGCIIGAEPLPYKGGDTSDSI